MDVAGCRSIQTGITTGSLPGRISEAEQQQQQLQRQRQQQQQQRQQQHEQQQQRTMHVPGAHCTRDPARMAPGTVLHLFCMPESHESLHTAGASRSWDADSAEGVAGLFFLAAQLW